MRWLVTGAGGQLGRHVTARLNREGADVVALTRQQLDITARADVGHAIATHRPDVVINAAAYTAVDAAETDERTAHLVNAVGPELLAAALAESGGRLIHVSTDYVFDGTADRPYEPADPVGPQTAYGRTKLAGEIAVRSVLPERSHIVRTAWVWGGPGPNFVDTMLRLEWERPTIDVVNDQIGSPTWVGDLASALVDLGLSSASAGTLHYVNSGQASWFDLAQAVFASVGADPARVRSVRTDPASRPAPRPPGSALSTASVGVSRTWFLPAVARPVGRRCAANEIAVALLEPGGQEWVAGAYTTRNAATRPTRPTSLGRAILVLLAPGFRQDGGTMHSIRSCTI